MSNVPISLVLIYILSSILYLKGLILYSIILNTTLQRLFNTLQVYWLVWFDAQVIFKTSHEPDT